MIELIMTMAIAGILAVVALLRMLEHTFNKRGFHDAVKVALEQILKGQ